MGFNSGFKGLKHGILRLEYYALQLKWEYKRKSSYVWCRCYKDREVFVL